jgi:hypothetical protein
MYIDITQGNERMQCPFRRRKQSDAYGIFIGIMLKLLETAGSLHGYCLYRIDQAEESPDKT